MNDYLETLNLIDLISEKHKKLRSEVMRSWLEEKGEEITDTEAHLLGMLEIKSMTVAESARKINLSRQATHKCARKLIEKDYIDMNAIENNKRDKLLTLTKKGKNYCNEMLKIKELIEQEVALNIGSENIETLKMYLRKDWLSS